MPTDSSTSPEPKVILGCARCGATLPDEAQYCLQCGKPVSLPPKTPTVVEKLPPETYPQGRRLPRFVIAILLVLLGGFVLWAGVSDSPTAQQIQEFVGWKHDQVVLDSTFSVGPHDFRQYKFSLPEGSVNVAVVGQFTSAIEAGGNLAIAAPSRSRTKTPEPDNNIEVYVLSETAFTVWQNGYATSSLYESGKAMKGDLQADIPAGAGIYYLIFSNRASPKASKSVHATALLRYKSWLPEWFREAKAKLIDWIGLS